MRVSSSRASDGWPFFVIIMADRGRRGGQLVLLIAGVQRMKDLRGDLRMTLLSHALTEPEVTVARHHALEPESP